MNTNSNISKHPNNISIKEGKLVQKIVKKVTWWGYFDFIKQL